MSLILVSALVGCRTLSDTAGLGNRETDLLLQANQRLDRGELYKAKRIVARVLVEHPENTDAQKLMAEILDQEIGIQKDSEVIKAPEEIEPWEREREIKAWLERAQFLLHRNQYDQALGAAEEVFRYDPQNLKASQLIHEIKTRALEEGKSETLFVQKMNRGDIQVRVNRYFLEADQAIKNRRWGRAKLLVSKILLLKPEDTRAQNLYERIQNQLQSK